VRNSNNYFISLNKDNLDSSVLLLRHTQKNKIIVVFAYDINYVKGGATLKTVNLDNDISNNIYKLRAMAAETNSTNLYFKSLMNRQSKFYS
jgi:hypothetical protein